MYNMLTYENFNTSNKLQNKSQYHISENVSATFLPKELKQPNVLSGSAVFIYFSVTF